MRKSLTTIRKQMDSIDVANTRAIIGMFQRIAKENPDAVKASFNAYMRKSSNASQDAQVEFYLMQSEYLIELFDI